MLRMMTAMVFALVSLALTDIANASMSGPFVTHEEVILQLDALGFPWALARKVGVTKALKGFSAFEDLKALGEQTGNPFPYTTLSVTAYDDEGFFSIDVLDYPAVKTRDFEIACLMQRLAALGSDLSTRTYFYFRAADLRVFQVSRYIRDAAPDRNTANAGTYPNESVACATHTMK